MAIELETGSQFPSPLTGTRRLFGRFHSTVGLDVGGSIVKVAEVAWERSVPRLIDFIALPIALGSALHADPADAAESLERLFAARGWGKSRVVASLSGGVAFFRHLKLPNLSPADLLEAARWEGQNQLPYPADEVVVDYQALGLDGDGKAEVLLAGAPRRAIEQIVDLTGRAGIALAAVEVDALAVYRSLEHNGLVDPAPGAWALVCDLGHEDTTLTAFRGGAPRLVRSFPFSVRALAAAVAGSLDIDENDAFSLLRREGLGGGATVEGEAAGLIDVLVQEVQRSCEYLFYQDRSVTVASVFFSGGGASVSGLGRLAEMRVNEGLHAAGLPGEIRVQVVDPVATLTLDPRLHSYRRLIGPNYACAIGLALRGEM